MQPCADLERIEDVEPDSTGCNECLAIGDTWLHLRVCMICGHVACCDSSKNQHASRHAAAVDHPIVQSYEPGEDWLWCYVDQAAFELGDVPSFTHP